MAGSRPQFFTLDNSHPLAKGLVFAGLGRAPGSNRFTDSSSKLNHAVRSGAHWSSGSEIGRPAMLFDGSLHSVRRESAVVTEDPITIGCWIYPTTLASTMCAVSLGNATENAGAYGLYANGVAGKPVSALKQEFQTGTGVSAFGPGLVVNTWQHIACTFVSNTSRYAFKDGVAGEEVTTEVGSTGAAYTVIGQMYRSSAIYFQFYGRISDVMIWNRVLSTPEIQILANRSDPMLSGLIRPIGSESSIYDREGIR